MTQLSGIFILASSCLSIYGVYQPVEVYNFKSDCNKQLGSQSYISTCSYNFTRYYYLDKKGKLTANGTRYLHASRAGAVNIQGKANLSFTFRYGEVRWRSEMLPINCTDGKNTLEIRDSLENGRWYSPTRRVALDICLRESKAVLDPRIVYHGKVRKTLWKCATGPCEQLEYPEPLEGLHNYTLRWTDEDLTWRIDSDPVYQLITAKRDIPRLRMALTVPDIDTVEHRDRVNMILESVSVWQEQVAAKSSHALQPKLPNRMPSQATLVKTFSLADQCQESEDRGIIVPICDFEYIRNYYFERNGSLTRKATNALAAYTGNFRTVRQFPFVFIFQFGEVRWSALTFPSTVGHSVLNIDGPERKPETDGQDSVVRSVRFTVKSDNLSATGIWDRIWTALARYQHTDNSFDDFTSWTCRFPDCAKPADNLWKKLHNYTLRWTADELNWLLDGIPVYQMTDKKKIPHHPMKLKIYDIGGFDWVGVNMLVESVSVWQSQTSLVRPNLSVHFEDNFTGNAVNGQNWNAIDGAVDAPWYDSHQYESSLVSVENGTLRFQVRQTGGKLYFGRVDDKINKDLLRPGEVEFRMRFAFAPRLLSVLKVQKNVCSEPDGPVNHKCLSSSVPGFGFACDEWGMIKTMLDLAVLQPAAEEPVMSIPIDRQRKRYDRLLKEGALGDFHVYRIVWTEQYIAWYIDDDEIDREDLTTHAQYRLPEEPLSVSMGTLLNGDLINDQDHRPLLLMEIDYVTVRTQSKPGTHWTASHISIVIACVFVAVCGAVIAIVYRRRRKSSRNQMPPLQLPSSASELALASLTSTCRLSELMTRYTRLLTVPENCIDIQDLSSPSTILGRGTYGIVLRGIARCLPTLQSASTVVAVKILTDHANVDGPKAFCDEVKMMVKAGRHVNIVNILGVTKQERSVIILEYCKFGNLQIYLRSHKPNAVYVHVDAHDGRLLPFDYCAMRNQWLLVDEKNRARDDDLSSMLQEMLCTGNLIQFSSQISRGMEYLGSRCIIHRDLAARNVLVTERRVLKISDFGLARYAEQTYIMGSPSVRLPYLWMSPDTITTRIYSCKSDIWSFGVLLHEIFTLGEEPFSCPNVVRFPVSAFVGWLMQGNQMSRPAGSPVAMYEAMQGCWKLNADERPSFSELRAKLDALTLVAVKSVPYVNLDEGNQTPNQTTDTDVLQTHAELVNLQRMIGECCAEAANLTSGDRSTGFDYYVSWSELPFFYSESHI